MVLAQIADVTNTGESQISIPRVSKPHQNSAIIQSWARVISEARSVEYARDLGAVSGKQNTWFNRCLPKDIRDTRRRAQFRGRDGQTIVVGHMALIVIQLWCLVRLQLQEKTPCLIRHQHSGRGPGFISLFGAPSTERITLLSG